MASKPAVPPKPSDGLSRKARLEVALKYKRPEPTSRTLHLRANAKLYGGK